MKGGRTIDIPLAHIDVAPTLLDLCGAKSDAFDGRSFGRLLTNTPGNWPGRTLFFQWHRGDEPEKFRAFAARGPKYKLVQSAGVQPNAKWQPKYELFDIESDPFEEKDLAADKPEVVAQLKTRVRTLVRGRDEERLRAAADRHRQRKGEPRCA